MSYADFDSLLEAVERANEACAAETAAMLAMARDTRAAIAEIGSDVVGAGDREIVL